MRSKRFYYIYIISVLIIFPILNSVNAVAQEDYVSFEENDEFIWNITYDEELDDDMGDDVGINTTFFDIDEDVKAMKAVITWIGKEDKFSGEKGVKYKINEYDSKSRGNVFGGGYNWKLEDSGEEYIILEYDSDDDVIDFYQYCAMWAGFIAANNVNWKKVVHELDDDLSGDGYATYNEYDDSIRIHIYEAEYDYYTHEYDVEELDIWCEYTSDGILENYRLDYDSETVLKFELFNAFWVQYTLWVIIGIIALVAIVVLAVYFSFIYKKTPKKVAPSSPTPAVAPPPLEKTPKPEKIEVKPGEGMFCPYCGSKNNAGSKFCEYCGKNLEE